MRFKGFKKFSQGIEGIRKQGYDLLERDKIREREAGMRFLCKYDLKYLCKDILGYDDWDVVHDDMQEFMDEIDFDTNERQFKLLLIPRGHLKSSIITIGWSIQQILRDHNVRILISHCIWDHARGFARSMMQYFTDFSKLPKLFGDFKPSGNSGVRWSADGFTIDQRTKPLVAGTVTTTGVERTQTGQHYDIIILDDVVARENIGTKEQREKVKNFYRDCMSILEPDGIMIVVGTTWHDDDLYSSTDEDGKGLMYDEDFDVFKRVAEKGTEESVIFKNKFSYESLMKIKRKQGNYLYSSQYLLNPYPEEDMVFRKNWIRYWKHPESRGKGRILDRNEPLYCVMTIDPSMGKENSDYAAIVVIGIASDYTKYILEARHFKRRLEKLPDEVVKSLENMRKIGREVDIVGLEYFGFQSSLLKPIKDAVSDAGFGTHVELLAAQNNRISRKEDRILGLVPEFSSYNIYLHDTQTDLEKELLQFNPTIRNKSDDIIDALAWTRLYFYRKPKPPEKRDIPVGSYLWYINKMKNRDNTKLFQEFR